MPNKEVSVSVDLEELEKQLEEPTPEDPTERAFTVRSTSFVLGKDPRVGTKQQITAPDFYLIEILKDRLDNPYLQLNWKVPRSEIDAGRVIGFNVFRRRLRDDEAISFVPTFKFSANAFDKLSRGNKKVGKFSSAKKAINNIKKGSIPLSILNPNLEVIKSFEQSHIFGKDVPEDSPLFVEGDFERFFSRRKYERIAYVDYSEFLKQEKNKFLFVVDRNFVDMSYKDRKVGYQETFEYYIESVTKELEDAPRSDTIIVTLEDVSTVALPKSLIAKQVSENEIRLSICVETKDKIEKALIYRRSEDEIFFDKLIESENLSDCINIIDNDVKYTKTYIYRIFLQNVHGILSEPQEVTVFSSVQKITPQSRSNSLKIPILIVVQDQNSDFARVTIYPNDPNISFYELKRRDLTINEKRFSVPSKLETNFGGNGWVSDKFFVETKREPITFNPLKTKITTREIVFIDDTVSLGHIYQYRTRGYDLFGNPSSYALSTVKVRGKKSIRTPINIKSEILRGFPFRIKISWSDDNLAVLNTAEELFAGESELEKKQNKILYKVERRKLGEITYERFPLTANTFLIDEVSTVDAVNFEGKKISDVFTRVDNTQVQDEKLKLKDEIRRAFKLPAFLQENDIYFYRITAISNIGEESNPSEEFQITTSPDLSDPLDFAAEAINVKVRPTPVRLSWNNDPLKARPDRWIIERKFDAISDSFSSIGFAYLDTEFLDKNVELGNTYIYRIKSFDVLGRESSFFETRITL